MSALLSLTIALCPLPPGPALPAPAHEQACALLAQPGPEVTLDRGALEALLADPEFAHARDRKEAALEVLLERLRLWLMGFFESSGAFEYAKLARVLVLVVALTVGLLGAASLLRRRRARRTAPAPQAASPLTLEDPSWHLARARTALAADAREAIREGLLALLSSLERRRLARPDRVKTNRELADELPARGADPALTSKVRALLGWYDASFYSLQPVDRAQATAFVDDVAALAGATG